MDRARKLYVRAPNPRDALDIDEEFAEAESPQYMNAAVVRSKEERRFPNASSPVAPKTENAQKRFTPLEAYVMFCVVVLFLFVMAMPRHSRRELQSARARDLAPRGDDWKRP